MLSFSVAVTGSPSSGAQMAPESDGCRSGGQSGKESGAGRLSAVPAQRPSDGQNPCADLFLPLQAEPVIVGLLLHSEAPSTGSQSTASTGMSWSSVSSRAAAGSHSTGQSADGRDAPPAICHKILRHSRSGGPGDQKPAGHQDQGGFVVGFRPVSHRLWNVVAARRHRREVVQPEETHVLPEDLGNRNAFPVLYGLL